MALKSTAWCGLLIAQFGEYFDAALSIWTQFPDVIHVKHSVAGPGGSWLLDQQLQPLYAASKEFEAYMQANMRNFCVTCVIPA